MQCGHFVSRAHSATRYNILNCQSQCLACNIWKHGNIAEFAARLIERYGKEQFDELIRLGRSTHQFTAPELQTIINLYT